MIRRKTSVLTMAAIAAALVLGACSADSTITTPAESPTRPTLDAAPIAGGGFGPGGRSIPSETETGDALAPADSTAGRGGGFGPGN
jgi:hypothetical protein